MKIQNNKRRGKREMEFKIGKVVDKHCGEKGGSQKKPDARSLIWKIRRSGRVTNEEESTTLCYALMNIRI